MAFVRDRIHTDRAAAYAGWSNADLTAAFDRVQNAYLADGGHTLITTTFDATQAA
jgi:hypothetical protein